MLGSIWFLAGTALILWSALELWQIGNNSYLGTNSGAFKVTLISLTYSLLCILGSIGLMNNKNWGRIMIILVSSISILYAMAYLLMGGFEDTGLIYLIDIAGLLILSVLSMTILLKKEKMNI